MTDQQRDPEPIIEVRGVSRRFGSTQALDGASLALYPGEVHALIGENGAGKSTLIKVMTGVEQPDTGELVVDGQPRSIASALDAQALGIVAIYQEPMVFPDLSVAENVFISHRDRGRIVNRGQMQRDSKAVFQRLGVELDVEQPARGLTVAEQQTVEIAKALSLNARVLIMDEPTSSLSANETRRLFRIVESLRQSGVAVLFISHRMDEVFEIADRITILRDGRWIRTARRGELARDVAIRDMVGRDVGDFFKRSRHEPGPGRPRGARSRAVGRLRRDQLRGSRRRGARVSPAWSARTAPTSGSPCSAWHRPTAARSRSTVGRCGSPARTKPCGTGSPT